MDVLHSFRQYLKKVEGRWDVKAPAQVVTLSILADFSPVSAVLTPCTSQEQETLLQRSHQ